MFRGLLLFLLVILNLGSAFAVVPAPVPTCVTVSSGGSVQVTWTAPSITISQFVAYKVYRSPAASSTFTLIGSVGTYATTWYLDNGINANTSSYKYYVVTEINDGSVQVSQNSDTVQTMKLNVLNGPLGASLFWNSISNLALTTSYPVYYVYQRSPSSAWSLIDTVSATSAEVEVFGMCTNDSLYFKIELRDSTGCSSFSNVVGKVFRDQTYPAVISYDSVSVDTLANQVIMGWAPNPSRDVRGYIIYKNVGGLSANNLDTVYGKYNTTYRDINVADNPSLASQSYSIATFDSCFNTTPWRYYQKTIYLTAEVNPCEGGVVLSWTKYRYWPSGLKYSIYATSDSVYSHVADITNDDSTYTHRGVIAGKVYCYVIRVYTPDNTKSSLSNKACVFVNIPRPPDFNFLKQTTVISASEVQIDWYVDPSADVKYFNVMRAKDDGVYELIDTIQPGTGTDLTYVDDSLETSRYIYKYYLAAVDTCGNVLLSSNLGTSIRLKVDAETELINNLIWNSYQQWPGSEYTFEIYRSINGNFEPQPLVTLSDTSLTYSDDVISFSEGDGNFCYYVQAVEGAGNPYGLRGVSKSDVICVRQLPRLYIPNAFTPNGDGINDVFKAENVFVSVGEFSMVIYNRKGQLVFETSDPTQGWDGTYKGEVVPTGVYPYYIYVKSGDSTPFHKGGTITVLP